MSVESECHASHQEALCPHLSPLLFATLPSRRFCSATFWCRPLWSPSTAFLVLTQLKDGERRADAQDGHVESQEAWKMAKLMVFSETQQVSMCRNRAVPPITPTERLASSSKLGIPPSVSPPSPSLLLCKPLQELQACSAHPDYFKQDGMEEWGGARGSGQRLSRSCITLPAAFLSSQGDDKGGSSSLFSSSIGGDTAGWQCSKIWCCLKAKPQRGVQQIIHFWLGSLHPLICISTGTAQLLFHVCKASPSPSSTAGFLVLL